MGEKEGFKGKGLEEEKTAMIEVSQKTNPHYSSLYP